MTTATCIAVIALVSGLCQQGAVAIGDFKYVEQIDPITDENTSYIFTNELEPSLLRTGSLVFRRNGLEMDIYVAADEYLNSGDSVDVIFRFDSKEPEADSWRPSTNGTAAFLPGKTQRAFIESCRRGNKLTVRLTDYQGTPHTYQFSLGGFTRAFTTLAGPNAFAGLEEQRKKEEEAAAAQIDKAVADWQRALVELEAVHDALRKWNLAQTPAHFPPTTSVQTYSDLRDLLKPYADLPTAEDAAWELALYARNVFDDNRYLIYARLKGIGLQIEVNEKGVVRPLPRPL